VQEGLFVDLRELTQPCRFQQGKESSSKRSPILLHRLCQAGFPDKLLAGSFCMISGYSLEGFIAVFLSFAPRTGF
jgi:hypothetical protein